MNINTLYWEITGACNQACKHCHIGGKSSYKQRTLEEDLFRIDYFAASGVQNLLLTGGEPLINKNIYRIIKKARIHDMDTAVLTNGTLINEERAEKIADSKANAVQISIDGLYGLHDAVRGYGAFNLVERAISNLKKNEVMPLMKLTITKMNIANVIDVIDYCDLNELRLNLSLAQELGSVESNSIMPSPQEYFKLFLNLYNTKKKRNLKLTLPDFSMEEYLDSEVPKSGCSAGCTMATITKDDKVVPCVFMSGLKLEEAIDFKIGCLSEGNDLFSLLQHHNSTEFGCPLRKFRYGRDLYSVYEFKEYLENGTI